jgi:hypothetical protein
MVLFLTTIEWIIFSLWFRTQSEWNQFELFFIDSPANYNCFHHVNNQFVAACEMYMPVHAINNFALCFPFIKVSTSRCTPSDTARVALKLWCKIFMHTQLFLGVWSSLLIIQISHSAAENRKPVNCMLTWTSFHFCKCFSFIPRLSGLFN